MSWKRRDFLKASGVAAGVALLDGCRRRQEVRLDQRVTRGVGLPGASVWRPGVCGQCPAGCGTLVRIVDGAAKKIEGNPDHPVGRGGICALGHSALQGLYHPDRITKPLKRRPDGSPEDGLNAFEEIAWDQALEEIASLMVSARGRGPGAVGVIAGGDEIARALWRRFAAAIEQPSFWSWRPADEEVERVAAARVFGFEGLPVYDLEGSDFVLGLGAAFLDRWRSPVHMARSLVEMRVARRSRFVQAESRMSLTAAAADEWLPVVPGSEGVLARALGGWLLERAEGGLAAAVNDGARYRELYPGGAPSLEDAARVCGVEVDRVRSLAAGLSAAERPLVIAGGSAGLHSGGLAQVTAGMALNWLLGSVRRGAVSSSRLDLTASIEPEVDVRRLRAELAERFPELQVLLVSECDPLPEVAIDRGAPRPKIVALASMLDDTAVAADLILPVQTDLERFQAVVPSPGVRSTVLGLAAPTVEARGEARHPADIVLALAATQGQLTVDLPWTGVDKVVQSMVEASSASLPGAAGVTAVRFLRDAQNKGGVWSVEPVEPVEPIEPIEPSDGPPNQSLPAPIENGRTTLPEPAPVEPADPDRFAVIPFETVKSGPDGAGSTRPWLQELPDPMATVMWNSWAEIATADAERLAVKAGDRLRLSSDHGSVEVGAVISPAMRPGCVGLPVGLGHRDGGRYSRGVNLLELWGGGRVLGVGVAALGSLRVVVEKAVMREREPPMAIYGRGLRQAENIPVGWAPAEDRSQVLPRPRARRLSVLSKLGTPKGSKKLGRSNSSEAHKDKT